VTIYANLPRPRGRGLRKEEIISGTGPAAAVSVGAGAGADVAISISPALAIVDEVLIGSISGLPANIGVGNIVTTSTSVTLHAINPTAAAITIGAGTVTVKVRVIGYSS